MIDTQLTVITQAPTYDLVDLDTVKEEFDITTTTEDDRLSRWISVESANIANYCNRVFPSEKVSETFYLRRQFDMTQPQATPLQLTRFPVSSIVSVTEDHDLTALPTDQYEVDQEAGLLYRMHYDGLRSNFWCAKVTVVYFGGYLEIPPDLQEQAIIMIGIRRASRGRDMSLRSFTIDGVGSETYGTTTTELVDGIPIGVAGALADYRVLALG